ncbi:restriction endonuclease subunit S [Streptomyces diastaticus]|uniref:restriction endonuclease subunit S n=1 Tax=Streptomyces TaxID=1883 RepID=UPI000FC289E6|nr:MULTISPECIES: restriction endonuclease subunit S [Streptomyces]MCL6280290.1 restriction endonuclease subunit S [Streptomyces albidoflavus]RPK89996.1 Type-1 restriction enzyme EcoKI specificity protein [Streptomyces sp. ADI98-12]
MKVPSTWITTTLRDLNVEAQPGFASGQHNRIGEGVLHLRPMNVTREGKLDLSDARYVNDDSDRRVRAGEILFNNTNSPVLVGKTALFTGAKSLAYSNHMTRLRPPSGISSHFLAMQLHWLWASGYFQSVLNNHVNQASVATKKLLESPIVLPPLAEQHRIVEAVEGHLSRLDAAEGDLKTAQAHSRSLQRSALERAINGRFDTRSDRDEPVSALFKQVEAELSLVTRGKRRKAPELAELSPQANLPSHWAVRPLGTLARKIEYGTSAKAHADPSEADVPVLRMGNIQDGCLDFQNLKYLPAGHPDTTKLLLSDGDILFNRTNSAELVGKAAVYRAVMGPATFASYLIRCQLAQGVEPEWVSLCINSPEGRRYIKSVAAQQVGQANVNGTKLAAFPIPVPPHGEQLRLLAEVREWHETVERTARIAQRALKRSAHLRRSLLNHAFSGQLVPQDPADEPASILLDRIRAEREAQGNKPKRAVRRPRKAAATADAPPPPPVSSNPPSTAAVQQELPL